VRCAHPQGASRPRWYSVVCEPCHDYATQGPSGVIKRWCRGVASDVAADGVGVHRRAVEGRGAGRRPWIGVGRV
jgi:hypothetical protein